MQSPMRVNMLGDIRNIIYWGECAFAPCRLICEVCVCRHTLPAARSDRLIGRQMEASRVADAAPMG